MFADQIVIQRAIAEELGRTSLSDEIDEQGMKEIEALYAETKQADPDGIGSVREAVRKWHLS